MAIIMAGVTKAEYDEFATKLYNSIISRGDVLYRVLLGKWYTNGVCFQNEMPTEGS